MNVVNLCGDRIQKLRDKLNLSQDDFSKKIGISRNALSNYERGLRGMDITVLETISRKFNISCDYLLGRSNTPNPDIEVQAICKKTGLLEDAYKFISELAENSSGETISNKYITECESIQNEIKDIENRLDEEFIKAPEKEEQLNIGFSLPCGKERNRFFANQELAELRELRITKDFLEGDLEECKKLSVSLSNSMLQTINKLFISDGSENFFRNLSAYLYTDFSIDTNIISMLCDKNREKPEIEFNFSSEILSGALLIEIQKFFQSIKTGINHYILADIDTNNDSKLDRVKSILHPKEKEANINGIRSGEEK